MKQDDTRELVRYRIEQAHAALEDVMKLDIPIKAGINSQPFSPKFLTTVNMKVNIIL